MKQTSIFDLLEPELENLSFIENTPKNRAEVKKQLDNFINNIEAPKKNDFEVKVNKNQFENKMEVEIIQKSLDNISSENTQENYKAIESVINNFTDLLDKNIEENNLKKIGLCFEKKYESKVFQIEIKIINDNLGIIKSNPAFYSQLEAKFLVGTKESFAWKFGFREGKKTKGHCLNDLLKYVNLRINHVLERSDTNQEQKNEVNNIKEFIKEVCNEIKTE